MPKYIDLSHSITNNMPVHPYDDSVKLYQDKFLETDKYNNFRLEIGMHSGTHIDTPMHLTNKQIFVDEIDIDNFIGKGCLLDVRGEDVISYKEEYSQMISEKDIVILYTHHSNKFGKEDYYTEYPTIDKEFADFLIKRRIKMLGMDLPSPDKYPFQIHKMLFNSDILIIENLTNLSELITVESFEIMAVPLKIRAEASMVRVIAKVL